MKSESYSQLIDRYNPSQISWENFVVNNEPPRYEVKKDVYDSWKRCKELGLDPFRRKRQVALSKHELKKLLLENMDLIEASEAIMHLLEISLRGTGFITTLADKSGYVLKVCGDEEIMKMAKENYYLPGCCRLEEYAGTNAIGLCLIEKRPVQLTGAEHFNIYHHPWTCSSAPIFDTEKRLIGAITLSGKSIGKHQHTLALVISAAKAIESRIRERGLINEKEKLNNLLNSIFDSISDGVIATNNDLVITHMNNVAINLLSVSKKNVIGKTFDTIFEADTFIVEAIKKREYFSHKEVSFFSSGKAQSYICSISPIQHSQQDDLGTILTLHEKKKVIKMVQKIGGNYAKYQFDDIKGKSLQLLKQIELAKIAAKTNSRILIIGESGTGKELFAQSIHNYSNRKNGPFVAISCAAIPRDLIEAELFGYVEGAFTGARKEGQVGKFELADKGTLFLDEINGLPLDLQAKLLRVLEQNEITRLGDTKTTAVDVSVIAASSTDLLREVENKNFREDLYYRINVVEIFLPPLRERMEDFILLINYIMDRHCNEIGIDKSKISNEVMKILEAYHWPGNVRELENCIERAILLSKGEMIRIDHLPLRIIRQQRSNMHKVSTIKEGMKEIITVTLNQNNGNISLTAKHLEISRSTLYRKMKEYDLR